MATTQNGSELRGDAGLLKTQKWVIRVSLSPTAGLECIFLQHRWNKEPRGLFVLFVLGQVAERKKKSVVYLKAPITGTIAAWGIFVLCCPCIVSRWVEDICAFMPALSLPSGRDLQLDAALAFFHNWPAAVTQLHVGLQSCFLSWLNLPMAYHHHHVIIFVLPQANQCTLAAFIHG